jgi:iron complex outermembrane receptor protein
MLRFIAGATASLLVSVCLAQEDAVVVTATRFPDTKRDLPVGVTLITAEDIQRSASTNLAEILAQFGLVSIRDNTGSPNQQVDLRGFGITGDQNTVVLVDGIRISENELSSAQLSSIPLDSIERIEVVRGSGAVLYGGGASGGTINIITRRLEPGQKRGSAAFRFGGYGTKEVRGGYGSMEGNLGLSLDASYEDTEGYRRHNEFKQGNVAGVLDAVFGPTRMYLRTALARQHLNLPGALTEAQIAADPRQVGFAARADRDDATFTLGATRRDERLELGADLSYRDKRSTANFGGFIIDADVDLLSFQPRGKVKFDALGRKHDVTAGIDIENWDYDTRNPFGGTTGHQNNRAIYGSLNFWAREGTRLVAGGRLQQSEQRIGAASEDFSLSAWELAARQRIGAGWSAYGKFGTSFRLMTFDEVCFVCANPLLQPQTARGGELGAEYDVRATRLRVAVYAQRLKNEIYFSPLIPPLGANTNLSPTERQGLEVEAATRLAPTLDARASFAWQQSRFRSGVYGGVDVSGKDVPLVPETFGTLGLSWAATGQDRINAAYRYVGAQWYDNDQANAFRRMPTYHLVDLKYDRRFTRQLSAALELRNVFDESYYSYGIFTNAPTFSAYPQPGRALYASVAWRLD